MSVLLSSLLPSELERLAYIENWPNKDLVFVSALRKAEYPGPQWVPEDSISEDLLHKLNSHYQGQIEALKQRVLFLATESEVLGSFQREAAFVEQLKPAPEISSRRRS